MEMGLDGIGMVHNADLPARSGLGSSSTFTVGFLHALYALQHRMPTKRELANNAIHVEQTLIGENVGSQDQTAAAFGGLNRIDFGCPQNIVVRPIILSPQRLEHFQNHLMLFFSGFSRFASVIAEEQVRTMSEHIKQLDKMLQLVDDALNILVDSERDLDEIGELLHKQWLLKKQLSSQISTEAIDQLYESGLKAGALGGKLLGAGGGGFMLFYVKPEDQDTLKEKLKDFLYVPFRFDFSGSQIIYYSHHS